MREILVRHLGFLHAEEVGLMALQHAEYAFKAGADGVHVPGDDFHAAKDRGAGRK